jgi:hypothetical protein
VRFEGAGDWHSGVRLRSCSNQSITAHPSARIAAVINVESRAVHVFRAGAAQPEDGGHYFFGLADLSGINRAHHVIAARLPGHKRTGFRRLVSSFSTVAIIRSYACHEPVVPWFFADL